MIRTLEVVPYDKRYEYFLRVYKSHDGQFWRRVYEARSTPNDDPYAPLLVTSRVDAPFYYEKWWKRRRGTRTWKRHAEMRSWPGIAR